MKSIITLAVLAFSLSSLAAVELRSQVNAETCTIKGDKVTKTTSLLNGELKFTTTETVKIEGLEKIARIAAASNTGTTNEFFTYELILDGQTYVLNTSDSKESMMIVNMMSRLCKTR